MACKQNNVMTALLLSDETTRKEIIPLVENLQEARRLSEISSSNDFLVKMRKAELEATVYSKFMFGDKADIYKPLLVNKFIGGFSRNGQVDSEALQNMLKLFDDDLARGSNLEQTMQNLIELGLSDEPIDLSRTREALQKKLILDYVSKKNSKLYIPDGDGTKQVGYREWLGYYTKTDEVPPSVQRDPVYQSIKANEETLTDKQLLNRYVVYKAVTDGNVEEAVNLIKGKVKTDFSVDEIDTMGKDELEIAMLSNLDNKEFIEKAGTKRKEITDTDLPEGKLMEYYSEKGGVNYKPSAEEILTTMQINLNRKLNFLNKNYGTQLTLADFEDFLNKFPEEDTMEAIDAFVKQNISSRGKNKIENSVMKTVGDFFRNYYITRTDLPQMQLVNLASGDGYKLLTPEQTVFVKIPSKVSGISKKAGDIFSEAKLAYRLNIGDVNSVEYDKLNQYLKDHPEVTTVLVQTQDAAKNPELLEKIKSSNVTVKSPTGGNSAVFDVFDGKLVIASDDFNTINRLKTWGIENGSFPDTVFDEGRLGESLDERLKLTYPDKTKEQLDVMKSFVKQGNTTASANDFQRFLDMAITSDRNSQLSFTNLDEVRKTVSAEDIKSYLKDIGVSDEQVDALTIKMNKNMVNLYIDAKYASFGDDAYQKIAKGQIDLMRSLGISGFEDLVVEAKALDMGMYMLNKMFQDNYSTVMRWNGLDEFVNTVRNTPSGDSGYTSIIDNEFFNGFLKRNGISESEGEAIFDKMKGYIDEYDSKFKASEAGHKNELYVVKDYGRYGENSEEIIKNIPESKGFGNKSFEKRVDAITKNIETAINEYDTELQSYLSKLKSGQQISTTKQRELKYKLLVSLRENEISLENLTHTDLGTNVYNIPTVYTNDDVRYLNERIVELKQRYNIKAQSVKESSNKPVQTAIKEDGKAIIPTKSGEEATTITNDDQIRQLVTEMPDNVNLKELTAKPLNTLNNTEKSNLIEVLKYVKQEIIRKAGLVNTMLEAWMPGLSRFVGDYTNTEVKIGERTVNMPYLLTQKNTLGSFLDGVSTDVDLTVKERIHKKITDIIIDGELSATDIESAIRTSMSDTLDDFSEALSQEGVEDAVVRAYMSDFYNYSLMPKLDQELITNATNLSNRKVNLTPAQEQMLSQVSYRDEFGRTQRLTSALDKNITEYPDILYREEKPFTISQVQGGAPVDRSVVELNTRRAVDDYENGQIRSERYDDVMINTAKEEANPIMDTAPRLRTFKGIINRNANTSQQVYDQFKPILFSGKTIKSNLSTSFGFPGQYDANYVGEMVNKITEFMKMTPSEFTIAAKNPDKISNSAWNVANHYRNLRDQMSNLTTDRAVNRRIVEEVNSMFENIVEQGADGKYGFIKSKTGVDKDWVGTNKLQGILTASKHGAALYGLPVFRELGIGYKKKGSLMFGFGNEFYDEGLDEFNRLFNSSLDINQYRTVAGALVGDVKEQALSKMPGLVMWAWNAANSPFMRLLSTIPGSYITGVPSAAGYVNTLSSLRKINESWGDRDGIRAFRNRSGVLRSSAVDAGAIWAKNNPIETDAPVEAFMDGSQYSSSFNKTALKNMVGQGLDNGQNVVDGVFGDALKNEAFIGGARSEGFSSLKQLEDFLNDPEIDQSYKDGIYNRIINKAYDMHEGLINYVGRGLTRNMDTGSFNSKIAGVTSMLMNPINFRAGLGNNAILNTTTNLKKLYQYSYKYGTGRDNFISAVADDPVLKQWLMTWINDAALAFKLANTNDYGESMEDRQLDFSDIINVLDGASQNRQFLKMSAGARTLADAALGEGDFAYDFLQDYTRLAFRQLRVGRYLLERARVAATGDPDNTSAYFNKMLREMSTGAARYMTQDAGNTIFERDTGISTLFGGNNKYQDEFYSDEIGESEARQLIQDGKVDTKLGWKILKDMLLSSELGKTVSLGGQILTEGLGVISPEAEEAVSQLWGTSYNKAYMEDGLAVTGFRDSKYADKFVDGKYNYEYVPPTLVGYDYGEKNEENSEIIRQMKLPYVIGSQEFADMIDSYKKTGNTAFLDGDFAVFDNESLTAVLKDMDEKGILDDVYTQTRSTRNKEETERILSQYMISYIDGMENKPLNFDVLQHQIANSFSFNRDVVNGSDEQKAAMKKLLNVKKINLNDYDKMDRASRWIATYWDEFQNTYSDGRTSTAGLDVAINLYAKNNPEMVNAFFDVETDDAGNENIKGLKPKYESAIKKRYQLENDLAAGIPPRTAIQGIYGPYSLFAARSAEDQFKYNKEANIEGVLHLHKFINSLAHLTKEERDYLNIKVMSNMPEGALDISEITERMGPEIADGYRQALNQTYKSATNAAFALKDDAKTKNGYGAPSIKIGDLTSDMKVMSDYMNKNKSDMFKPLAIPQDRLNVYGLPEKSRGEMTLRPPKAPAYSAKSIALLPKPKAPKSNEIKPTKPKILKTPKKKGAKKKS